MKLYYGPGTCALAIHIALAEVEADYELQRVDFKSDEQRSSDFLRINPLGRVPVLETEAGILTEAPAILSYIALRFPEKRLLPNEPFEIARMYSFMAFLSSSLHVTFAHHFRPYRWADHEACRTQIASKARKTFATQFGMASDRIAGPWVMGERFTVADPYFHVFTRWIERLGLNVMKYPTAAAHLERMKERPAVAQAMEEER